MPQADINIELPFTTYPKGGRQLLGRITGSNCRHEYGLHFQQLTRLHSCAYCGMSLVDTFEHWLQICLDHVVPSSVCIAQTICDDFRDDAINKVLACAGCNTFGNRYKPEFEVGHIGDRLEAFCEVRDKIFQARKEKINVRRELERDFYSRRLWLH